jgi:hypothetical protein
VAGAADRISAHWCLPYMRGERSPDAAPRPLAVAWQDREVLAGTAILVMTSHDDKRAGVRRDAEGCLWISLWWEAAPDRVAGTRLEGVEPAQIRGPDWSAVGGVLPEGARSAEVRGADEAWQRAEVGEGSWVAFIPWEAGAFALPAIRFADERGALVSSALASARRVDAGQAQLLARSPSGLGGVCPACGATDWRAARSGCGSSTERIFCGVCGHSDGAVHGFWSPGA